MRRSTARCSDLADALKYRCIQSDRHGLSSIAHHLIFPGKHGQNTSDCRLRWIPQASYHPEKTSACMLHALALRRAILDQAMATMKKQTGIKRLEPGTNVAGRSELARREHTASVEFGILDSMIAFPLKKAQLAIYEELVPLLARNGLTPVTFTALAIIDKNPGVRQTDLGKVLGIARSGVVKIINRLETSGLIVRTPVADDRRVYALALTVEGAKKWTGSREAALAHEALVSARLSDGEKKLLIDLLRRI